MEIDSYMFACVNQNCCIWGAQDETRRLCDCQTFPVLKLGDKKLWPRGKLDSKIGVLIGRGNLNNS